MDLAVKFTIILSIFILYGLYVIKHFGIRYGINVTLLTWAFFVLCTPVADAGILIDFPIRLLFEVHMLITEIIVITIAIIIAMISYKAYRLTPITRIFHYIVTHLSSIYGLIIVLSISGTLMSVVIFDKLYDVFIDKSEQLNKSIINLFVVYTFIWIAYLILITHLFGKIDVFNIKTK